MEKKLIDSMLASASQSSIRSLVYGWPFPPTDHFKSGYFYDLLDSGTGKHYPLVCNLDRNQWIVCGTDDYGDGALSLAEWYCKAIRHTDSLEDLAIFAKDCLDRGIQFVKDRILATPFNDMPVVGRSVVLLPYEQDPLMPVLPGISLPTLKRYARVAVLPQTGRSEMRNDPECREAMQKVRAAGSLSKLSAEDREFITRYLQVALAMPTTGGGCYVFTGEKFQLYGQGGFTICGNPDRLYGGTCYVYDSPFDFLALMENRRKLGADMVMSEGQHLILNGSNNLKDAMQYLSKHCDFGEVVCLLPNTKGGEKLFAQIQTATRGTAASQNFLYKGHPSLYGKSIGLYYKSNAMEEEQAQSEEAKLGAREQLVITSPETPAMSERIKEEVKTVAKTAVKVARKEVDEVRKNIKKRSSGFKM